jgi:hypothetical protein
MSGIVKESFNWTHYKMLLVEDRKMIDEYVSKMAIADVNSFMKRLIDHYEVENTIEVDEDIDSIVVFEANRSLLHTNKNVLTAANLGVKSNSIKIFYERAMDYFNAYFANCKNDKSTQCLAIAINKYLEEECSNKKICWPLKKSTKERIFELYVANSDVNDRYIRKIDNSVLPVHFYTYRVNIHNGILHKTRLGVAIDNSVLPLTHRATAGYGQNFKMMVKSIFVKLIHKDRRRDISLFVKNAGYWAPENAALHNFGDKTGIIWFQGKQINNDQWQFPDGTIIGDNLYANVSVICISDAFLKMFQRFDFGSKIHEIVLQLESVVAI